MSRPIDADHLKSMLQEYIKREQAYIDIGNNTRIAIGHSNGLWEAIAQIDEEPTIEPQQEIITCRECRNYVEHDEGAILGHCIAADWFKRYQRPTDYCSRAERRRDG